MTATREWWSQPVKMTKRNDDQGQHLLREQGSLEARRPGLSPQQAINSFRARLAPRGSHPLSHNAQHRQEVTQLAAWLEHSWPLPRV